VGTWKANFEKSFRIDERDNTPWLNRILADDKIRIEMKKIFFKF